jgi:ribosomal protein L11 methyltransferase
LAERAIWPVLAIRSLEILNPPDRRAIEDQLSALLDDHTPLAIHDMQEMPLPPGGVWDPTCLPPPDPLPSALDWRVFFAESHGRDAAARAVAAAHPDLIVTADMVADENWAARSQQALTAIQAGHVIVAPPWDVPRAVAPGVTLIVIEPSRGFGTGHHASTRLCLRALSELDLRDARVLDVGTGSGVLAMAAARRGAREVAAIDVDADSIDAARESAGLNTGVNAIRWMVGDFRTDSPARDQGPWDVVFANLTGGMLIASAARVRALVRAGGTLVASGFQQAEQAAVEQALGMSVRMAFDEETWVGLVLANMPQPGALDA